MLFINVQACKCKGHISSNFDRVKQFTEFSDLWRPVDIPWVFDCGHKAKKINNL